MRREHYQVRALAGSEHLIAELEATDLLVIEAVELLHPCEPEGMVRPGGTGAPHLPDVGDRLRGPAEGSQDHRHRYHRRRSARQRLLLCLPPYSAHTPLHR